MLEAVYISDATNNLVFERLTSLQSPLFKQLYGLIEGKLAAALAEVPIVQLNREFFVCVERNRDLFIYVLVSQAQLRVNPLMPFVFMRHLRMVMEDYLGSPLVVTKIDANNDTLNLLVNEMIDDGMPHITEFNRLRDIVPLKSLLLRITNEITGVILSGTTSPSGAAAGVRASASAGSGASATTTATPWRRTNVRYTNNEMFVDVVETINVVLKPRSKRGRGAAPAVDLAYYSTTNGNFASSTRLIPVTGTIEGCVNFTSHLTGVPDLQMILNVPGKLKLPTPSFHRCVRLDHWDHNHTLSFIPPDGASTLMQYQVDVDATTALGLVEMDFQTGLGPHGNQFELRLNIRQNIATKQISDLAVTIHTDNDSVGNVRATRCTHGDFLYRGNGLGEWTLRNVATGIQPILRGEITSEEESDLARLDDEPSASATPEAAPAFLPAYFQLAYNHKGTIPSGIKVDLLKIMSAKGLGDSVKPYKGVKYITHTGEYIVRT